MSASNIHSNNNFTRVQSATAAGTTDVECDSVDMAGYESVVFFTTFGAITGSAVTSVKVETSTDDSSFTALLGTGITVADSDDDQTFSLEIRKPLERYLRFVVDRATQDAVVGECYAMQSGPRKAPITNAVTDNWTLETHLSPIRGTA